MLDAHRTTDDMSDILLPVISDGKTVGYLFECPGCECSHIYATMPDYFKSGMHWQFNGNIEAPSFTPSLLNRWGFVQGKATKICHLHVTDGKIVFCDDCTHSLAGQTVPMIPFPFNKT